MSTRQAIGYEVWESTPLETHQFVVIKTTRDHLDIYGVRNWSIKTKYSEEHQLKGRRRREESWEKKQCQRN